MSKLTKEQWNEIDKKLSSHFGFVDLLIDGYKISLVVRSISRFKQAIVVFVNDTIEFNKINGSEEAKRFWSPHRVYLYSPKERKKMKRIYKELHLLNDSSEKFIILYWPYWTSFTKMKAHLKKNNESIKFLKEEKNHEQIWYA